MKKNLKRHITGLESTRTPDISILNVDFIFGKGGKSVVNLGGRLIKEMNIIENMRYLTDQVHFIFNDRMALLPEMLPFNGNEKIRIEYGQDIYQIKKAHYNKDTTRKLRYGIYDIFKTNFLNVDLANPTKWQMEFFLINTLAKPLFDMTRCRTFKDMTISEIIERLIEPCTSEYIRDGDLNIDIEPTTEKGTFVQPMGWTNAQMINYLTELAGDYVFMIYGTNIMFKSVSSMLRSKPVETLWVSHKEYSQKHSDQKHKIIIDSNFFLNNYFFNTIGARGVTIKGYNFDEKKSLSSYSTIKSQEPLALGEKFPLTNEVLSARGRFKNSGLKDQQLLDNKTKCKNLMPFMNILSSFVLLPGRANREVGTVVETVYKTAEEDKKLFNEIYSGEWIINTITHTFRGESSVYFQKIELRRNAFGRGSGELITPKNIKKSPNILSKVQRQMRED